MARTSGTTAEIKLFESKLGLIVKCIAGFAFIGGGGKMVKWALEHEQHQYVWAGIGLAVFGAWILPSVSDTVAKIYVTVFPNGLPLIGGRRSTDPQPPAPPSPPSDQLNG